jgi:hypothetical protein
MQAAMQVTMQVTTEGTTQLLPGSTNARRATQFTRFISGVVSALVGMGRRGNVFENLSVAVAFPVAREHYFGLYQ